MCLYEWVKSKVHVPKALCFGRCAQNSKRLIGRYIILTEQIVVCCWINKMLLTEELGEMQYNAILSKALHVFKCKYI